MLSFFLGFQITCQVFSQSPSNADVIKLGGGGALLDTISALALKVSVPGQSASPGNLQEMQVIELILDLLHQKACWWGPAS